MLDILLSTFWCVHVCFRLFVFVAVVNGPPGYGTVKYSLSPINENKRRSINNGIITNNNSFAKTICPICYEDLKPIVEDLQSISICGHVFHELCLQQWFEYCPSNKKCSCPVCKQSCSGSKGGRLYFQSVGDQNESLSSRKPCYCEGGPDPILLQGEVNRLGAKVLSLSSILDRQGKEIKQLNDELHSCNDNLKKEAVLRNDALEQKESIQRLLFSKTQELDALKLERLRLQDRNMGLAKELAAVKLVSDLNLDEDEALKLATFGNQSDSKDTIDILRKSLVIRNKSYKELMAKCNQLGRGEALSCQQLEKAKQKVNKLKTRVQELEKIVAAKDHEVLRPLKATKKHNRTGVILNRIDENSVCLSPNNVPSKDQKEQSSLPVDLSDHIESLSSDQESLRFNILGANFAEGSTSTSAPRKGRNAYVSTNEAVSELFADVHVISDRGANRPCKTKDVTSTLKNMESNSDIPGESRTHRQTCINIDDDDDAVNVATNEITSFADDIRQAQPILNIRRESPSSVPLSRPGEICFSSGLLGPDGTNRYLGKWCKRGQGKGSLGTGTTSGDLITVGSDGRGGRVKVLRSLSPSSLDAKRNSAAGKKSKYETKPSSLQSQGCLQMEHFFGKASK